MDQHLVNPRLRIGQLAATRSSLPVVFVLPLRAYADEILPRRHTDGMTRAIITSLSKVADIHVINASTALKIRSPSITPRALFTEFGANYVLSAQVVRIDQDLSFYYALTCTQSGDQLWNDYCGAHLSALAEFEKKLVHRVINSMVPRMREADIVRVFRKPPHNRTAYDLMLQALSQMEALDPFRFANAERLLDDACRLDPSFASAHAWRARVGSIMLGQGWTKDRAATARQAIHFAVRATEIEPANSLALATAGHLSSYLNGDLATGQTLLEQALDSCPNDALAWSLSSVTHAYLGDGQEGRRRAEHAIWLSPLDQNIYQFYHFAGLCCYANGDYADAVRYLRRSLAENSSYTSTHKALIAALVGADRVDEAREMHVKLAELEPQFGANGIVRCPFRDEQAQALYRTQLRTAGVG